MNGEGILKWIYRDVLERVFDSNLRTMALALRVSERTLQKALDNDAAAESMLVFEQMMEYCMQHEISVDAIIARYRCYNGAVQAKNCSGQRTYSAVRIEDAVLATVRQYFSTFSETIDEVWKEQAKAQLQRKRGLDIRNAQAELTKLQQRQNKLKEEAIKALTGESVYAPEMIQELLASNTEAMNKAEAELQNAEKDRAELDAKLKELVHQYESIHDWAEVFDAAGVDEKKMILSRIIGKITVNRNYDITIYFFLTLDDFKHALAEEGRDNVKVCEEPVRKRRFA